DPAELLNVDVDRLTRPFSLIAPRGLEAEPAELAHPDPSEDPGDRREGPAEELGDLRAGEANPAQRRDHHHRPLIGAVRDPPRRRRTIQQPPEPLSPPPRQPLPRGPLADSGRLGGLRQRPPRPLNTINEQLAALQAETSVSVQPHPMSSLGLVASAPTSLQGGPDEQRPQELQLDEH